jgi:hypothetical protein
MLPARYGNTRNWWAQLFPALSPILARRLSDTFMRIYEGGIA